MATPDAASPEAGPGPGRSARIGRTWQPVAVATMLLAAAAAVHVRDPHVEGSWGFCPLKVLTGWDCPGCGGLRATHDVTHLDLWSAASSNLLLVLAAPVLAVLWIRWLVRTWRGEPRTSTGLSEVTAAVLIAVVVGFTVLRNLPVGVWLAS